MAEWVEEEFQDADFGDRRLGKRIKAILTKLADAPTKSLAGAMRGWAETIGAYRFFDNPKVTLEKVMSPHRQALRERLKSHPRALVVQDTTELDFTPKKKMKGPGPLSTVHRRGFFAHTHLVVTPDRLVLGVLHAQIYAREDEDQGKSENRKQLPIEEKESYRWLQGYREACRLAQEVPDVTIISCSDREGDLYDIFQDWQDRKQRGNLAAEWLIRCSQDRSLLDSPTSKLKETLQASPLLGVLRVDIKANQQQKKIKNRSRVTITRSARKAILEVRARQVTLKPPARKNERLSPVTIQIMVAEERRPPAGEEPISWVLLTSLPISDFQSCQDLLELYLARWEIEVFFRVLKTGCRVEDLQLRADHRVFLAVVLYMIVAWRVLYVMRLGRVCPELPCDGVFDQDEWQAFWVIVHGQQALSKKPSLGEFLIKVAEFGGFLARPGDGPPGPKAIWIGMSRVRDFALAWQIFGKGYFPDS